MENFADGVSLQASDDVAFAEAFDGAPGDVVDGWLVETHPNDDGAIDRGVQLSVSAVVDAMAT